MIYGEEVEVLSEHGEFVRIRGRDGLAGYVKKRLVVDGDRREFKLKHYYDAGTMKFPFGSYLSKDDVEQYKVPSELLAGISDYDFKVTELSGKFLTIPYLWGGTSDFGFDCSGMVQRLYRFVGKEIPRNADQQRDFTETVPDFDSTSFSFTTAPAGQKVTLIGSFPDGVGIGNYTYSWYDNGKLISNSQTLNFMPYSGTNNLVLDSTGSNGTATSSFTFYSGSVPVSAYVAFFAVGGVIVAIGLIVYLTYGRKK